VPFHKCSQDQIRVFNKCGLRAPLTVSRTQRDQVPKHVERSTSSRLSRFKRDQTRFQSNQTRPDKSAEIPLRSTARASAAPSIVTVGGAACLFLDVRDRNPAQRILNDLADHVQLVVAR